MQWWSRGDGSDGKAKASLRWLQNKDLRVHQKGETNKGAELK